MSKKSVDERDESERLKCSFYSSDDARSFGLLEDSGPSACLVCVAGEPGRDALVWLKSFLGERFRSAFAQADGSGHGGGLVAFLQSSHADLFKEGTRRPEGLAQVSLVAAHVEGHTIEIAAIGTCAAYRTAASGVDKVIPSDANGGEGCYLGVSLKVSVEMVRRRLAPGVGYLLTSRRVDLSAGWDNNVGQALKVVAVDAGSAAGLLFGAEGGAFATLESGRVSDETVAEETPGADEVATPISDAEEAATPAGTVKTLTSVAWKRAPFIVLAVALGVAIYMLGTNEGGRWAGGILRGGRTAGHQGLAGATRGGTLSVSSIPPGAEVMLDDSVISSRTPVSSANVSPGLHRLTMRLGDLGEWSGSVNVRTGDTANVEVAFVGQIAVNSKPQEGLSVLLDGEPRGFTPCLLESVPAGLHIVKVEGKGFSSWEEEVLVAQGGTAEVQVSPGKLPATGVVRVTAAQVSEEGYAESNGRAVFIDGRQAGATPLKINVKPGFHSIRVAGTKGDAPSVTVIQVRPGGKHFIKAEFAGVQPILVECLQTRMPSGGQVVLCASLAGNTGTDISRVELYLEKLDSSRAGWEPMTLLSGSRSVYAAAVPLGFASGGDQIRYFAKVTTAEGLEYFSDVATLTTR
ncbi:MAG: PEGA domain-containing protein [Candidatus Eisenbacteria bacterium]|nr:PEGA domain-containing protein [Candidatus Eisenbacteria bacterium]